MRIREWMSCVPYSSGSPFYYGKVTAEHGSGSTLKLRWA
jgi:hypothetical protein